MNLSVSVRDSHGFLYCEAGNLRGTDIHLDFPSVGATENIMMASVLAEGETHIYNSAKEPEIVDLQNFLNKLGANVRGAGTDHIEIVGVKNSKPRLNTLPFLTELLQEHMLLWVQVVAVRLN